MAAFLVFNPSTDEEFVRIARRLLADGAAAPIDLQIELRRTYPKAIVRRRILDAERFETWYVYREGTWVPPNGQ